MFAGRTYTPEPALPEEMTRLHKGLHMQRVVIVTPSIYGTDNTSSLYGMKARGANARGVAVIDHHTTESELDTMGLLGVRGIRLNLATGGVNDPAVGRQRFQAALARMQPRQWHIQMYTNLAMISGIKDAVAASPVPVVFDHFGGAQAALGTQQGLLRPGGLGALRKGLREDFRGLPLLEEWSGLCGRRTACAGAHHGERGSYSLGHRLAAPERSRRQRGPHIAVFRDRRRTPAEPTAGVGAGRGGPEEDTGGQSRAALPVLTFDQTMRTVIANATLIDCVRPEPVERACVVIENGRIAEILTAGRQPAATGAAVVDLGGACLLPGLWDVHVHPDY